MAIQVIKVKINDEERDWLKIGMKTLQQVKTSTALKQLAKIGYAEVVLNRKNQEILEVLYNNLRKNARLGIGDVLPEIRAKVDHDISEE